ncbi:hypothetical protein GCM10026987_13850 [Belliella aquatica]|uniref:Uncharacterized protein n=1 Tax=Belliella aquatica TaxID=1323734 RepID=A0ABQ1LKK9_9BACT|nr:hypothetical protein GCM10010993_01310 [Belliella aquatica]
MKILLIIIADNDQQSAENDNLMITLFWMATDMKGDMHIIRIIKPKMEVENWPLKFF